MATKIGFQPADSRRFTIENPPSFAPLEDKDLTLMLDTLSLECLRETNSQYLSIKGLDYSGISSPTALLWQSRVAAGTLSIEGTTFPFSDQLDCTLTQLSAALGENRSLELKFITPSASTFNAIIELIVSNRLEHLELRGFLISDNDVEKLSTVIAGSAALRSLVLQNLRLSTDHFIRLSNAIQGSKSIENLTIKSDWIQARTVPSLKEMIESSTSLKAICLTLDKFEKIPSLESLKAILKEGQTLDLSENWGY